MTYAERIFEKSGTKEMIHPALSTYVSSLYERRTCAEMKRIFEKRWPVRFRKIGARPEETPAMLL